MEEESHDMFYIGELFWEKNNWGGFLTDVRKA